MPADNLRGQFQHSKLTNGPKNSNLCPQIRRLSDEIIGSVHKNCGGRQVVGNLR